MGAALGALLGHALLQLLAANTSLLPLHLPGSEQLAAPLGQAAADADADLPGHICGHRGQQAPADAGPGGGEAARKGALGRLQVSCMHGPWGRPQPGL